MNPSINMISDGVATPSAADGDEDLYIDDDLELGSQGYKPGGGTWAATSDIRLKKDITPFGDGLNELMNISPVRYKYNDIVQFHDPDKEYVGIIAQDMLEIAPYMIQEKHFFRKVHEDEHGNEIVEDPGTPYYTYDGTALTYIIVNAIKEQQAMIKDLQNSNSDRQDRQLDQLRAENRSMRQELNYLRQTIDKQEAQLAALNKIINQVLSE